MVVGEMLLNELNHYGILGMKWGVRRTYEQIHGTKPRYIKKGTKMYRVGIVSDESLSGHKYVTYLAVDRDKYKGWYADTFRENVGKKNAKIYEQEYTLKEDLKIPSRSVLKQAIRDVAKDEKLRHEATEAYFKRMYKDFPDFDYPKGTKLSYDQKVKEHADNFIKTYKDQSLNDIFSVMVHGISTAPNFRDALIVSLKKKGYNAMADENSIGGRNGFMRTGYDPLLIFDGEKSLEKTRNSKEVTSKEQRKADKRYQKWYNTANKFYGNEEW